MNSDLDAVRRNFKFWLQSTPPKKLYNAWKNGFLISYLLMEQGLNFYLTLNWVAQTTLGLYNKITAV